MVACFSNELEKLVRHAEAYSTSSTRGDRGVPFFVPFSKIRNGVPQPATPARVWPAGSRFNPSRSSAADRERLRFEWPAFARWAFDLSVFELAQEIETLGGQHRRVAEMLLVRRLEAP